MNILPKTKDHKLKTSGVNKGLSGDDPLRIGLTQSPDFASQNWLFSCSLNQKQAFDWSQ
jgi:hypothetical protein